MSDDKIWFVVKGPNEEGPYTPAQLERMVREKAITGTQELRRKGETKSSTVDQARALKRQIKKNSFPETPQISTMDAMIQSTAFRAFLLFILLLVIAGASLYYTGMYKNDPWATWLQAIGLELNWDSSLGSGFNP